MQSKLSDDDIEHFIDHVCGLIRTKVQLTNSAQKAVRGIIAAAVWWSFNVAADWK